MKQLQQSDSTPRRLRITKQWDSVSYEFMSALLKIEPEATYMAVKLIFMCFSGHRLDQSIIGCGVDPDVVKNLTTKKIVASVTAIALRFEITRAASIGELERRSCLNSLLSSNSIIPALALYECSSLKCQSTRSLSR